MKDDVHAAERTGDVLLGPDVTVHELGGIRHVGLPAHRQVVEHGHRDAFGQQRLGEMRTDETRPARH